MRTTTVTRFLPLSLLSLLLAVAGCGSKPAATPESSNSASPSSPSGSNSASNGASTNAPAAPAPAPLPPPPPPPPIVIPAGTTITVTLDQTVNSQTANNGDPFAASLAVPVTSGTWVVLPVGTKVGGTVVTAQSAGKFKGNALLQLVIDSVRIDGTRYPMQPNEIKGAAMGAWAGGGAGTAGAAFTGKKDIVLPAETRLHFKLAQPLSVPAPDAPAPAAPPVTN